MYGSGCSVDTAIVLKRTKLYMLLNTKLAFMLLFEIEVEAFLKKLTRLVHNQVLFGYLIDLPYKASSNRIFNIPCNLRHRYLLNWLFIRPYK